MPDKAETYLILKYGSVDTAYRLWITREIMLHDNEIRLLAGYASTSVPKLKEIRDILNSVTKVIEHD